MTSTLAEFIDANNVTMEATPVESNPGMSDTVKGSQHYSVTLTTPHGTMQTFFSVGSGVVDSWIGDEARPSVKVKGWRPDYASIVDTRKSRASFRMGCGRTIWAEEFREALTPYYRPELANILDCLASDSSSYENARNFEDFASDMGYDTDSRRAERIYNACGKLAKDLRFLLGGREAFEELMYEVERL